MTSRQAYEKYEEAKRRFGEVKNNLGVARAVEKLGMLARVGKRYGEARNLYKQSLAISKELGARVETANLYRELGLLAQSTDEYEEAHDCFSRALALGEEVKDGAGTVSALMRLGEVAERRQGSWTRLVSYTNEAS